MRQLQKNDGNTDHSRHARSVRAQSLHGSQMMRTVIVAVLTVAVLGSAGCSWFRHKSDAYQQSAENRPLEVPPDLNLPDTEGAMRVAEGKTQSVTRSSMAPVAGAGAPGFTVAGDRDAVFTRVGGALAAIEGVTIASKAQLLGAYDVSYEGANFLVRVSTAESGVFISAVDPRGQPATAAAPAKLIKALQAALGG